MTDEEAQALVARVVEQQEEPRFRLVPKTGPGEPDFYSCNGCLIIRRTLDEIAHHAAFCGPRRAKGGWTELWRADA